MKEIELCEQCETNKYKYKCPKCAIRYCSKVCFQAHPCQEIIESSKAGPGYNQEKNNQFHELQQNDEFKIVKTDFIEDQDLRVPRASLRKLRGSQKIKQMLTNKQLRAAILEVDDSKYRIKTLQAALREPEFQEFADEVLNVLGVVDAQGQIV